MKSKTNKQTVLVAMSGGVDSSVVACMLKEQGCNVIGVFMHFWSESGIESTYGEKNKCCSLDSFNDARRVAQKYDFPIYTLNLDDKFKKEVVDEFLASYGRGETPNPCVQCNKVIKFTPLIRKADELGADFIATGHYAKIIKTKGGFELWRPKDTEKDQTYFLYNLTQKQLARIIFPLADMVKADVRKLAAEFELAVAEKRESQEICFVPEKSHNDFLKRHLNMTPGKIITMDGEVIGEHQGLALYTIGQRKGLEIGGTGPYYAAKFDYNENILYATNSLNDAVLFKSRLVAHDFSWLATNLKFPLTCRAVIRYHHQAVSVTVNMSEKGEVLVDFLDPQRAITPGQSVVLYSNDNKQLLGGGIIG